MGIIVMHKTLIPKYKGSLPKLENKLKKIALITISETIWKYKHCLEEGRMLLAIFFFFPKTLILFPIAKDCGFVSSPNL